MKKFAFLFVLLSLFAVQPVFANFPDVNDQTLYKEAIEWTVEEEITQGYNNGNLGPNDCVTRAQLLKMVLEYRFGDDFYVRSYGLEGLDDFSDVSDQDWHYDYIRLGQFLDVVEGYTDETFMPDICVNRVEAMKIASKTLLPGEESFSSTILHYDDKVIMDMDEFAWYAPYARRLFEERLVGSHHTLYSEAEDFDQEYYNDLLSVVSADQINFFPAESMSRKEVAEMLYRIYKSKITYPNVIYEIREEGKDVVKVDQQSLVRINQDQTEEVVIDNMLDKYKAETKFKNLVAFDTMIRGKIKGSDELILEARYYENDFLSSKLFRLNVNTLELKEFKISQDLNQLFYYRISPDGNHLIWISIDQLPILSFQNPNPYRPDNTMYLVDLLNDTYKPIVKISEDEIFHPRDKNSITLKGEWLDNQRIKYSVYQITEDRSDPLLGYHTVVINEPLESYYLSSANQDYLPYFYIEPNVDPQGIFIYMHGAGGGYEQGMSDENYAGNFGNLKQVLSDMNFVYATPETSSFGGAGGADLVDFMIHLKEKYGDLPIYLSGASAGGGTIFHALNKLDDPTINLKGAVFVVPAISTSSIGTFDPAITDLKFWIEAGELDGVFPPDRVEVFEDHLSEKGYQVQSNVIPEGDHNAPVEQIDWQGVLEYLVN